MKNKKSLIILGTFFVCSFAFGLGVYKALVTPPPEMGLSALQMISKGEGYKYEMEKINFTNAILGTQNIQGVKLTHFHPKGLLKHLKFEKNDYVVEADGEKLLSKKQFEDVLENVLNGQSTNLRVVRNKKIIELGL